MAKNETRLLSGRIKTKSGNTLDSRRTAFLSLDNAEPNFGNPDSDRYILASLANGERLFLKLNKGFLVSADSVSGDESTFEIDPTGLANAAGTTLAEVLDNLDSAISIALVSGSITDDNFNGSGTSDDPLSLDSDLRIFGITGDSATFTNITRTGTTVTAGTYGSVTEIPVLTVDASGFVDSIGEVSISTTLNTSGETGTGSVSLLDSALNIAAGEGINTVASGNTVTVSGEDATITNKGVASFDSGDFTVSSGHVSIKTAGVGNSQLENDTVTIGSTGIALGETSTTLSGLTQVNTTNLSVTDSATISQANITTLDVTDSATIADATVTGVATINQVTVTTLDVSDSATISDLTVDSDANLTHVYVSDLTDNRVVIAGASGRLEDDANFTFNGTQFDIGGGNFTVQQSSGNTQIVGTLDVDQQTTLASANVQDLTNDRLVIAGTNGELEDDANLTYNGSTLTVANNTTSTNSANGALVVTGGVGIGGALNVNGNTEIAGDLTVTGTTTTIEVQTLAIQDPLIHLADSNESADEVDIGFVGHYFDAALGGRQHTGLFRDATDDKYYLFAQYQDSALDSSPRSNVIDRSDPSFVLADFNAATIVADTLVADTLTIVDSATIQDLNVPGTINTLQVNNGNGDDAFSTAVGVDALVNVNSGTLRNTAFGRDALEDNTSGQRNTAIGQGALANATTGSYNTAIGQGVMGTGIVTGNYNTALGITALNKITTGPFNTAIGSQSPLGNTTTGQSNVAIGPYSLTKNEEGSYNVAVGRSALAGNSLGDYTGNIAIGANALDNLEPGQNNNTVIGYRAGRDLDSGTRNTIIGFDAEASATFINDEITLGNDFNKSFRIPGSQFYINGGSEGTTGSRVGINTSTPTEQLDVNGNVVVSGIITADSGTFTNLARTSPSGVTAGVYGSVTEIPVITVDASGFIDSIGEVAISTTMNTAAETGTGSVNLLDSSLEIAAGEGINTTASGRTITVAGEDASTSNKGVASFDAGDFSVSSGAVSIKTAGVGNDQLEFDSVTVTAGSGLTGGGTIALGSSAELKLDSAAVKGLFSSGDNINYNSSTGEIAVATSGVVAGTYGTATKIPVITVDEFGQVDSVGLIPAQASLGDTVDSIFHNPLTGQLRLVTDVASFFTDIVLDPYTTDSLSEGTTNLYYTKTRVDSDIDQAFNENPSFGGTGAPFSVTSNTLVTNLNADLLDGRTSNEFLLAAEQDFKTVGDLIFFDNVSASFGQSEDLRIYHDQQNSYINETGTGNLKLLTNGYSIILEDSTNDKVSGQFTPSASVDLYYNGSKKFETTNTGVDVTGNVVADGGTIDGQLFVNYSSTSNPAVRITSTDGNSQASPELELYKNSTSASGHYLGQLKFTGENSTGGKKTYAKITGKILDNTNGSEDGIIEIAFQKAGSNNIAARFRSDRLDLINGTDFNVNGDIYTDSDLSANNITRRNTTVTAGTYGSITAIPVLTVDASGFVDSVGTTALSTVLSTTAETGTGSVNLLDSALEIAAGSGIDTTASGNTVTVEIDSGDLAAYFSKVIVHDNTNGFVADEHVAHSGVTITAGNGLTGGGDITSTRTLTVGQGTGITVGTDAISTNDGEIVHDNLSGFVANEHINHSGVSITAGKGLTGGGDITTSRTIDIDSANIRAMFSGGDGLTYNSGTGEFTVVGGDGITANADEIEVTVDGTTIELSATNGSGAVRVKDGGITNAKLQYDSSTIGTTSIVLGGSTTTLDGLTQLDVDNVRIFDNTVGTSSGDLILDPAPLNDSTGTVVILGDLQVNGITTTINSNDLSVKDKNIVIADSATGSSQADGAGITVGVYTDNPKITYRTTGDKWEFNKDVAFADSDDLIMPDNSKIKLGDGGDLQIIHNGTNSQINNYTGALQIIQREDDNDVIIYSDDGAGGITEYIRADGSTGEAILSHYGTNKLATKSTGVDVNGEVLADSATINGNLTVTSNIVVNGTVDGRDVAADGVTLDSATALDTPNAIVLRDASGNFSAGTITAALSGNASTATTLANSRDFSLTGDVTATAVSFDGSGNVELTTAYNPGSIVNADINTSAAIADTKLATISTAGKVSNSATTATSNNNNSAIVARDGSGNFSAGTITATLSGNASTATTATNANNVAITDDTTTNSTHYVHFGDATSGNDGVKVSSSKLTFNPSSGTLQVNGLAVATTADLTASTSPSFSVDSANFGTGVLTNGEGKAIYYDTSSSKWEGAYNDSSGEFTATHIIVDKAATDVKIASTGIFTVSGGLSANNYYFLSSTAGTATNDPDSAPTVFQPLYYALDANTIDVLVQAPQDTVITTYPYPNNPGEEVHGGPIIYSGIPSDERLKENIESIQSDAISLVNQLNPVSFDFKDPISKYHEGQQIGFIAQEISEVIPQSVYTEDDEMNTMMLKPETVIPILTKAIQELTQTVETLKKKVEDLETR